MKRLICAMGIFILFALLWSISSAEDPDKEYKALKSEVTRFQKSALSARAETRPSVGLGTDFRLESRRITGFALGLDDQLLHLSIFSRADGQNHKKHTSRMESFTQRRRNRVY